MTYMTSKLILIDYQNIQDLTGLSQLGKSLSQLEKSVVCEVFMGPNQKISPEQLQKFEYTTAWLYVVSQSGRNAADMRIVFRLGQLIDDFEFDEFYVLSTNKDFDSIIAFISTKLGRRIKRIENFSKANFRTVKG